MPRYTLMDSRGFVVGTIALTDDVIPESIMAGIEFRLGGQWVEGTSEFTNFLIASEAELEMTREFDREPMPEDGPDYHEDHAHWLARQKRRHG